jgi:hypothetical protein
MTSLLCETRPAEAATGATRDPGGRHILLVEGIEREPTAEALLRVLGTLAVQQVQLIEVRFTTTAGGFAARLEIEPLSLQRAEHLAWRLRQMPSVTAVSLGWRR